MTDIVAFLTAQLDADEKRLREGWYGEVYWQALNNAAALGGWTAAHQMGLTAKQCDQITDAASALVKERLEGWQRQEAEDRLADIAAKRAIIDQWRQASDNVRRDDCDEAAGSAWATLSNVLVLLAGTYPTHPDYKGHDMDDWEWPDDEIR